MIIAANNQDYTQRLEQAKARQEDLRFEVEAATVAYENYRDSLGGTDSAAIAARQDPEACQQEYGEAAAEVIKPEGRVRALRKTMRNSADAVSRVMPAYFRSRWILSAVYSSICRHRVFSCFLWAQSFSVQFAQRR